MVVVVVVVMVINDDDDDPGVVDYDCGDNVDNDGDEDDDG